MRIFLLLLSLSCSVTILVAQAADTIVALWPQGIPCANDLNPAMKMQTGIGRVQTSVHEPELHIFRPFDWGKSDAAVIICPGGGYFLHAWDWEGTAFARALNQRGITAAVLSYRLPFGESENCRSEVALNDAQRAVQMMRLLASREGFDPEKVALMGFSAGGHLAASASVHYLEADTNNVDQVLQFSSRPNQSILVYPVISMDTVGTGHAGSRYNLIGRYPDKKLVEYYSLETQVDTTTPPGILFHAADDAVVPVKNSLDYFAALVGHQVPAELHVYPTGGHGFSFGNAFEGSVRNWWPTLLQWLEVQWSITP